MNAGGGLSQVVLVSSLGLGAAVLMVRAGVLQRMIEVRNRLHSCASCGRSYNGRCCPHCDA
jgi:hypothetical protein